MTFSACRKFDISRQRNLYFIKKGFDIDRTKEGKTVTAVEGITEHI